jgi:hypothetical protein
LPRRLEGFLEHTLPPGVAGTDRPPADLSTQPRRALHASQAGRAYSASSRAAGLGSTSRARTSRWPVWRRPRSGHGSRVSCPLGATTCCRRMEGPAARRKLPRSALHQNRPGEPLLGAEVAICT